MLSVLIWLQSPEGTAQFVIIGAFVLALVLLVVSITDWCEHGTLFTGTVMMLYNVLLAHQALVWMCPSVAQGHTVKVLPWWFDMALCAATVLLMSRGFGGLDL